MENVVFFEHKSWWKDDIYWLLESSCFELFDDAKYGLFLSEEVDGKDYIYWLLKSSCFELSDDGKEIFFSAKKLMERWYLLGLFELSMMFQDLGNTVFHAMYSKYVWIVSLKDRKGITTIKTFQKVLDKA